jgi:peptidoglycan/LPS O-acetylase OafA/YrhL
MVNVLVARYGWTSAAWHTGHLWSLSLEEQFYLLWPALVLLMNRRTLVRASVGIMLGAAILRLFLVKTGASPDAIYVLLPTRMDALAVGAALAGLAREPGAWKVVARRALPVAVATSGVLLVIFHRESLVSTSVLTQTAGYPALALLGASAVVSAVGAPAGTLRAWFWNQPVLRFFGRYSYGLYAWHPFAISLFREHVLPVDALPVVGGSHLPGNALFVAISFAISIGVALMSWHVIEQPFLRLKRLVPYRAARQAA